MTSVTAGLNFTRSLANYESIKVNISITDDVREGEKVTEAFERVYALVEKKLVEKVAAIDEDFKS